MKITEITEGYTNEGWGEFKQAAKGVAGAVGGAVGRSAVRGARRVAAKMGSGKAQGALQMDKAVMGVMKNYQRYLGQASLKQDVTSLKNYLTALGIKNPIMMENFPPGYDPMQQGGQKGAQAKELSRNQVAEIIRKNIEAALKAGTLPKELKKFLGQ